MFFTCLNCRECKQVRRASCRRVKKTTQRDINEKIGIIMTPYILFTSQQQSIYAVKCNRNVKSLDLTKINHKIDFG